MRIQQQIVKSNSSNTLRRMLLDEEKEKENAKLVSNNKKMSSSLSYSNINQIILSDFNEYEQAITVVNDSNSKQNVLKELPQNIADPIGVPCSPTSSELNCYQPIDTSISDEDMLRSDLNGNDADELNGRLRETRFVSLVIAIEFYNSFMPLFRTQPELRDYIEIKRIEFDAFLQALQTRNSIYLNKIIRSLLYVIIKTDTFYSKFSVSHYNLAQLAEILFQGDKDVALQVLCRILFQIDSRFAKNTHLISPLDEQQARAGLSEKKYDVLVYDESIEITNRKPDFVKSLANEEFVDFTIDMKLEIVRTLCHRMHQLEMRQKLITDISRDARELKRQIDETRENIDKLNQKITNKPKKALEVKTVSDELDSLQKRVNERKILIDRCFKLQPIGQDKNNYLYWVFDCLPGKIYRELPTETLIDNMKISKWYEYDLSEEIVDKFIESVRKSANNTDDETDFISKLEKVKDLIPNDVTSSTPEKIIQNTDYGVHKEPIRVILKRLYLLGSNCSEFGVVRTNEFFDEFKSLTEAARSDDLEIGIDDRLSNFTKAFDILLNNIRPTYLKKQYWKFKKDFRHQILNMLKQSNTVSFAYALLRFVEENIDLKTPEYHNCEGCLTPVYGSDKPYVTCDECTKPYHRACVTNPIDSTYWTCETCEKTAQKEVNIFRESPDVNLDSIECSNYRLRKTSARTIKLEATPQVAQTKKTRRNLKRSLDSSNQTAETMDLSDISVFSTKRPRKVVEENNKNNNNVDINNNNASENKQEMNSENAKSEIVKYCYMDVTSPATSE